jgi:hypothetical protein
VRQKDRLMGRNSTLLVFTTFTMMLSGATKTAMEKARQTLPRNLTRWAGPTSFSVAKTMSANAATSSSRK